MKHALLLTTALVLLPTAGRAQYFAVRNLFAECGSNAGTCLSNIGGAPLASPAFTGTPTAPTASNATNNTQIATTAFVHSICNITPPGNGSNTAPGLVQGDGTTFSVNSSTGVGSVIGPTASSTTAGLIQDAPSNSNQYARQGGAWVVATGGIPDAPSNGLTYGRNSGAWVTVTSGGGGGGAAVTAASRPPVITDDTTLGYSATVTSTLTTTGSQGSIWVYGNSAWHMLQSTASHAVWQQLSGGSALPLDAVGGTQPEAAYGMGRLRQGYTGPVVKVQRRSDSTQLDIPLLAGASNLPDWTVFDSFCAGTTCDVATWYDQSTNARNATQTNTAQMLTISPLVTLGNTRPIFNDQSGGGNNTCFNTTGTLGICRWLNWPSSVVLQGGVASPNTVGHTMIMFAAPQSITGPTSGPSVNWVMASTYNNTGTGTTQTLGFNPGWTLSSTLPGMRWSTTSTWAKVPPFNQPTMLGYTAGSTMQMVSDSVLGPLPLNNTNGNQVYTGGWIGAGFSNSTTPVPAYSSYDAFILYARQLSATEQTSLQPALDRLFGVTPQIRDNLVFDGDVPLYGSAATGNQTGLQNIPMLTVPLLNAPGLRAYNAAFFNRTASQVAGFYTNWSTAIYLANAKNNIVFLEVGGLDVAAGTSGTGASAYSSISSYIGAAHATGYKVVLATTLPRYEVGACTGALGTAYGEWNNLNTLIKANAGGGVTADVADVIADFTSDPVGQCGAAGTTSPGNNTYYYNNVPNALGSTYLAPIAAAAIKSIMQ